MECRTLERWLNDGMPEAGAADARTHAATCAACGALVRAAEAVERGLATARFAAPSGFTERVMARVNAAIAERHTVPAPTGWRNAMPWWVRAAADPAVVAAMGVCALLLWRWDAIVAAGVLAFRSVAQASLQGWAGPPHGIRAEVWPALALALGLALLPGVAWLAREAYRWSEHVVARAANPLLRSRG
jgi:hypothetical protein